MRWKYSGFKLTADKDAYRRLTQVRDTSTSFLTSPSSRILRSLHPKHACICSVRMYKTMLNQHTSRALRSAFTSKRASLSPKQAPSTRTLLQITPKRPFSFQSTRPHIPSQYKLLHKTNPATRRPFTSTHSSNFGNQNRYNRFAGGTRQPLVFRLVQNAKPGHFVAIGVGISGVYLYNTDTVEVRQDTRHNLHYKCQRGFGPLLAYCILHLTLNT
jgi:hypothetical protein